MNEGLPDDGQPTADMSAAKAPAPERFGERLRRLFATRGPDLALCLALLGLFAYAHSRLEVVEMGGDAVWKWLFVRQWSFANDISTASWDHHATRMGVNGLTWMIQKIFGRDWRAYYIGPFFMAALQVPFVYLLARRLSSRLAGVLAVLPLAYLDEVHRSASQLLPDGYVGTWALIGAYLYARFFDAASERRRRWLIAMAVAAFIGYLCKETFFFFMPGFMLAIWLVRKSVRDVALFLGVVAAGMVIENVLYAVFTEYSSRYAIILRLHGANGGWDTVTFWQLFQRFDKLTNGIKYLLLFGLGGSLWIVAFQQQRLASAIVAIGLSHVFFLAFTVKSISPIQTFQSFQPRYMDPATPFLALVVGVFLAEAARRIGARYEQVPWLSGYGPTATAWHAAGFGVAFVGLCVLLTYQKFRGETAIDFSEVGARAAKVANDTYKRNLPLVKLKGSMGGLRAVYSVYMDDRLLAKDGKLPDYADARVEFRNISYLVKDPSRYTLDMVRRLQEDGCVVSVEADIDVNPRRPLPRKCDRLLERLQSGPP